MARKRGRERVHGEDGDAASFFKILHGRELSSEHMRRIPSQFLRSLSDDDFTYRVVLKVEWGNSWSIPLARFGGCIFMETCGWEEFVRDNHLGDDEFLVFTHQQRMHMNVKIFCKDGTKIVERPVPVTSPDARRSTAKDGKDVTNEEAKIETSDMVELHGGRKLKGETSDLNKNHIMSRRRDVYKAPKSSSSSSSRELPRFTIEIKPSYLCFLLVPRVFAAKHFPKKSMKVVIHDESGRTWEVVYLHREISSTLSAGWVRVVREMGLEEGDWCTLELFKSNQMRIQVSKTKPSW